MSDFDFSTLHDKIADLFSSGRSALLPALQIAQNLYGYLPEQVAAEVGKALGVPLADVHGVIEFYSLLYSKPVGNSILRVCTDPACAMAGSEQVLETICQHLDIEPDEISSDRRFSVERSPCLGLCDHAPALMVGNNAFGYANLSHPKEICKAKSSRIQSLIAGEPRLISANCGKEEPTYLDAYMATGGYNGLKIALSMAPEETIAEVKKSGLVGRGGAAFPTGIKWEAAANALGDTKYVICNGDESEPGTFKDRVLMEDDPHRVLEGLIIAGFATGAYKAYIYIRGEYPKAFQAISQAVIEANHAGFLGKNILDSGFDLNIELRLGAGAYICGEETAMFESIEGKRGFPRLKPPFPTKFGLFGKPTTINNVETLCNIPIILEHGATGYRRYGTERSPGTKLFSLSGDVVNPGLYEIPFGVSLHHLIYDLAGGVPENRKLQAILLGGAAGAFIKSDNLNVKMSFEHLQARGLFLGSGAVTAIDESRDLRNILLRIGWFFAHESCGKCYPCQLGTQRQYEILQRIAIGEILPGDDELLADVGWTMSDASICGLGQTAAMAVLSAIKLWPQFFKPMSN